MFDLFRSREKSVRIVLGVLLVLVAGSMLLYLIPGAPGSSGGGTGTVVATVGGDKITATDVQRALQSITRGQQNLPKSILGMYAPALVNQMVESKAMAYKANEMGLQVSDRELGDAIQNEFSAQLGGKFDMNIYKTVLAQQGLTVPEFEARQREAMLSARLENLEMQALIVSDADAKAEYKRKNLKIGLKYLTFDPKNFASKVNKDKAAVKAYFGKNRGDFRIPEKRDVDVVSGTAAQFVQSAEVSEADLRKAYNDNSDSYRQPERVQVRHILIKTQGKPKAEQAKLKAKAEDILKQLKAGAKFDELAKKDSEDPGSAEKGGELGYIVRGQTVPNFEKAAFSLQPEQLSGVIETEYGYHILQVENKQQAHTQTFEEVRPQLLADAQKQAGAAHLKQAIEAARTEISKSPDQAATIAAKYKLKFSKVTGLQNGAPLPELGAAPEVTNAIFAAAKGSTTNVVETGSQKAEAFAYVRGVTPARNAEYAEVETEVMAKYVAAESEKLAEEAAKSAAERAKKGESLTAVAKASGTQVKTAAPFTMDGAAEGIGAATLLSAAFKDEVGGVVGPIAAQNSQFVCQVSEKTPADMSQFAKNKEDIVKNIEQQKRSVQQPLFRDSVVSELKKRGKIKINQDTLNQLVSSLQS